MRIPCFSDKPDMNIVFFFVRLCPSPWSIFWLPVWIAIVYCMYTTHLERSELEQTLILLDSLYISNPHFYLYPSLISGIYLGFLEKVLESQQYLRPHMSHKNNPQSPRNFFHFQLNSLRLNNSPGYQSQGFGFEQAKAVVLTWFQFFDMNYGSCRSVLHKIGNEFSELNNGNGYAGRCRWLFSIFSYWGRANEKSEINYAVNLALLSLYSLRIIYSTHKYCHFSKHIF